MVARKVKYRINHILSMQPMHVSIDLIIKRAEKEFGIAKETFNSDRSISVEEETVIPIDRLQVYATLLGTSIEALSDRRT